MPCIATIGFFDGVHRGHRFLFAQLQEQARSLGLTPIIYTFEQHPKQVLTGEAPTLLSTNIERLRMLEHYAEVRVLNFQDVQKLTAEQFMHELYHHDEVSVLLMGYDHRFGSDGVKGFSEYKKIAKRVGIIVERAYECLVDGLPVSSTRIRKLLNEGQVQEVNRLLGQNYSLTGVVEHGNGIGQQIGFPTANISLNTDKQLPKWGVYIAHVEMDTVQYMAVVNVGWNPTVGNLRPSVEAHLIDYQGDLYGKEITISFIKYLREERKFASLADLQKQIEKDMQSL